MVMDFRSTLIAAGLHPKDTFPDGRFHRCPTTDKPKKKNGAYMLRVCGSRGYFRNYAIDENWNEWREDRPLTPAQKRQAEADLAAARKRDIKRHIEAIKSMRAHWKGLPPLRDGHSYLTVKQLSMMGCSGLRIDGDLLVIPALREGVLMSLQTITPTGEKKYRYGCSIKGASYPLIRKCSAVTCLTEGFATGLAVYQSVPQASVIVCFDAGNMVRVASEMKVRGLTVVCADNDWQTAERIGVNTGVQKGRSAANLIGCGLAYPEGIEGSDWADALLEWGGPTRVRMEILKQARPVFA